MRAGSSSVFNAGIFLPTVSRRFTSGYLLPCAFDAIVDFSNSFLDKDYAFDLAARLPLR